MHDIKFIGCLFQFVISVSGGCSNYSLGRPIPKTATPLSHVVISELLIQDFSECYLPSDNSNTILNNPQQNVEIT